MIAVSVVTGFLGSGKTTLISRILQATSFARVAVIVNEFGDVGLDHDLIASADDTVLTLSTGCLCCAMQTDLARTLTALLERRKAGSADYDRVLIETSGLSDPAPMLQALMSDEIVSASHRFPFVVTLVDTVRGEKTLLDHREARHQVALADRLLLSKTDLQEASDRLVGILDALNPTAPRSTTAMPFDLFGIPQFGGLSERIARTQSEGGHAGVDTVSLLRNRPLPALAVTMLLQALSAHCGPRLLRLKGIVAISEMPDRPMVIHTVGHIISSPEFLESWPGSDQTTRIVVITMGVPAHFVSRLLDAIEEEVRDAMRR